MVDVLCITCNVGALLKHVDVVSEEARSALVNEVGATVSRCNAALVAIHFQECPTPLEVVQPIVRHPATAAFTSKYILLDSSKQTGLCSLYMHNPSVAQASLIQLDSDATTELEPFGLEDVLPIPSSHALLFPIPKEVLPHPGTYSQKGIMHVCWNLAGKVWGFINLHLPHDNNNLESLEQVPSLVAQNRTAGLQWALGRCAVTKAERLLLFGDFNFRPSLRGVVRTIFQGRLPGPGPAAAPTPSGAAVDTQQQARSVAFKWEVAEANAVLASAGGSVDARQFSAGTASDRFERPAPENPLWEHDEGAAVASFLRESPVAFPPSYGYAGNRNGRVIWSKKRCPAWTDRVMMTFEAVDCLEVRSYDAIGAANASIKDHKPVYLHALLL
eukprot:GGOE01013830.1.p1 GENE.GGOE01013830.1~~GGOE01013830.1.p1  ORF type:complete len:387 (+),score=105.99 GGOE01013830.1:36-1196(+)